MKLNLLPQTEKKSRQGRTGIIVGLLIVAAAVAGSIALTLIPKAELDSAKASIGSLPQDVATDDALAKSADDIIKNASDDIRNAKLAQAMIDHNDVYPKLYDDVKKVVPPYYRLQSITAQPSAPNLSTVTLVGTLSGYQKYADLMLALMRFKEAQTISRSGYNLDDPTVPGLSTEDQKGKMHRPDEGTIPDDGLERLAYFQAQASAAPKGYLNTGYGDGTTNVRGPLPDASLVTIVMTVSRDLRVPLAADTLKAGGGAVGGVGAAGAAAGFGGPGAVNSQGPAGPPVKGGGRGGAD